MAQSRMAGMAMDLGPDDLADVGEAATMATNKMGMEQGQQATVHIDLDRGTQFRSNDGRPNFHVTGGGRQVTYQRSDMAYPIRSRGHGARDVKRLSPSDQQNYSRSFYGY